MHLKSFIQIFFRPELRAITSKKIMLVGTVIVMTLALWSIGFSNGTSEFLKEKMDSPFIKFLTVEIPNGKYVEINNLRGKLENILSDTVNQKRFNFSSSGFIPNHFPIFIAPDGTEYRAKVRPISAESPLYKFLFRNRELVITEKLVRLDDSPWSIVISESLLASMNIDIQECPPYLEYFVKYDNDKEPITVPLPIAAIVKQLPNQNEAFLAPRAYYSAAQQYEFSPFDPENVEYQRNLKVFIETKLEVQDLKSIIQACQPTEEVEIKPNVENFKEGYYLYGKFLDESLKQQYWKSLEECFKEKRESINCYEIYDYDLVQRGQLNKVREDNLLVNFDNLDSVEVFANFIYEQFEINANMNDIESGKNFNIFNKITKVLSVVLTFFAITMIVYIVSRTILEHIDRNSANLGTLKAYGLSNMIVTQVFSSIGLIIIISVFLVGYLLSYFFGEVMGTWIFLSVFDISAGADQLFELKITSWIVLWFILVPYAIIALVVNQKIKGKTPGDLIYGR